MERSTDELLTLEQAAERYDVSVNTLRRRMAAGELPALIDGKDRRRRLVSLKDLERCFEHRPFHPAA